MLLPSPHLGSVYLIADLLLPDPKALQRAVELEEARGRYVQKSTSETSHDYPQSCMGAKCLYGINNTMERLKNTFNWAHPRKTRAVFTLFVWLLVLFILVPSRYILLFLCLFFFTERFRPLGTMVIKAKHFIALLPTDDDLHSVATGVASTIKKLEPPESDDAHFRATLKGYKRRKVRGHRGSVNTLAESRSNINLLAENSNKRKSSLSGTVSSMVKRLTDTGSSPSPKRKSSLVRSDSMVSRPETSNGGFVAIGDAILLGHVRVYMPGSFSHRIHAHKQWKRWYCALYGKELYFWSSQENAERGRSPNFEIAKILAIFPTPDVNKLDPYCEMEHCILTVDREGDKAKSTKTCYIAFNSKRKALRWMDAVNVHCLDKHRNRSLFNRLISGHNDKETSPYSR